MEKKDDASCVPASGFKIEPKKFRLDIRKNPLLLVSIKILKEISGRTRGEAEGKMEEQVGSLLAKRLSRLSWAGPCTR